MRQNNYYPYGLRHRNYNMNKKTYQKNNPEGQVSLDPPCNGCPDDYKYKYNGQEWQGELGLNLYDMDMRDYDPAIGRWLGIDPVVHYDQSTYMGYDGNPVFWSDPSGASVGYSTNSITYTDEDAGSFFNALKGAMDGQDTSYSIKGGIFDLEKMTGIFEAIVYALTGCGNPIGNPKPQNLVFQKRVGGNSEILSKLDPKVDLGIIKRFENSDFEKNTLKWFAHGSETGTGGGMDVLQFNDFLMKNSELYRTAIENQTPLTIKMYACWTGTYGGLADQLSNMHSNLTIIAPNYTMIIGPNTMYVGDPGEGFKPDGRRLGLLNIYKGGTIIGTTNFKE